MKRVTKVKRKRPTQYITTDLSIFLTNPEISVESNKSYWTGILVGLRVSGKIMLTDCTCYCNCKQEQH
jgi:hypothetical protein